MGAGRKQLRLALKMYLRRGQLASAAIAESDWDKAESLLTWRKAAYYNFLAVERSELASGYDYTQDDELRTIYEGIVKVNDQLSQQILKWQEDLKDEIRASLKVKATVKKFHSGLQEQNSIQSRV